MAPRSPANADPEAIRGALACIPADLPRDEWARVAMALKSALGAAGLDLFDAWSQTGETYDEIRDITDMCGTTCFLVGMERFGDTLARYGHIASRVNRVVELLPLSMADVKATCDRLADVQIAPDLVAQIHTESQGRMRLVLNAIANVEQWAATNGLKSVDAGKVKGKTLVTEFKSRPLGRRPEGLQ